MLLPTFADGPLHGFYTVKFWRNSRVNWRGSPRRSFAGQHGRVEGCPSARLEPSCIRP
jgi:hypothetical protein